MSEPKKSGSTKFLLYVIGALVVLVIAMYVWKGIAVHQAGKSIEAERAELAQQQATMEEQMRQATAARVEEMMQLMAVPLGWAVRAEAIKDDYDQIEEYASLLVKQKRVRRVVLVNLQGNIRMSTDRKLQGEPASRFFGRLADQSEITLERTDAGDYNLMVPLLGYTGKLGGLIVTIAGD